MPFKFVTFNYQDKRGDYWVAVRILALYNFYPRTGSFKKFTYANEGEIIKFASLEEKSVKASLYERYGDLKKASEIDNAGVSDSARSEDTYSMYLSGMVALANNDIQTAENTANELDAYLFKNQFATKESYILHMYILNAKGKYKDAGRYFQKALEKEAKADMFNDPGVPLIAPHEMGIIYRENKEYKKAVMAFNDELKVYPLNGHAYYQLAKTYAAWGKNKEAKEYTKNCLMHGNTAMMICLRLLKLKYG